VTVSPQVADEAGNISVWSVAPLIPILSVCWKKHLAMISDGYFRQFKAVGESLTAVCMRNDLVISSPSPAPL